MNNFLWEFRKKSRKQKCRGVAIYLATVTLTIVLAIALGVAALSIGRFKILNEAGDAVAAYVAAETGIEWALLNIDSAGESGQKMLDSVTSYRVDSYSCGAYLCIKSIGNCRNARRAIKVQI